MTVGMRSMKGWKSMKKNEIVDAIFEAYELPESSKVPARVKYIEDWIEKYQLPKELFVYACQVTMEEWSRPNIKYTERLMGIWKGKGIQTIDAAKAAVSELRTGRMNNKSSYSGGTAKTMPSGSRMFHNFTERQNNNYMEKVLEKYRSGEYYGS